MVSRDHALERRITRTAARAASLPAARADTLRAFADERAHPGGVRVDADWDQEAAEEIADGANYLAWALVADQDGFMDGEAEASARYERRLRTLRCLVEAWHHLNTDAH